MYYSTGRIELMIDNHLTLEHGIHKTLTSAVCFDSRSKGCLFNRALPDITVRSGSPANFQSPDSPKTGSSPSRTPDFYHLKKWEKNPKKNPKKKKFSKIFFKFFFQNFFFVYLFGLGTFDTKFVFRSNKL